MNYKEQTKEIVEKIKKLEEEKYKEYGIKFNIETPTMIRYYIDSLKNGNFSLKENSSFQVKDNILRGITARGWANTTSNDICVLAKDYNGFSSFLNMTISDLKKGLPMQEINTTFITFHEIKHITQNYGIDSSAYDYFCYNNLSDYQGFKGLTNKKFHDSLYKEIDANLYGAKEAKKIFKGNADIEEHFDKLIGRFGLQKYTYDFDTELEKYQKNNDNEKEKVGGMYYYESFFWNFDGTFKRPKEIYNDPQFYDYLKEQPSVKDFNSRVISSDAYLSRLNMDQLDTEEISFIVDAIRDNNTILEAEKHKIIALFNNKNIDETEFREAMKKINNRITKKEEYRNNLFKKYGLEDKDNNGISSENNSERNDKTISENIDVESLIKQLTTPEQPKKVKSVTLAKEKLKSIIDRVSKITTGKIVLGLAFLAEVASMASGIGDPLLAATSVLGAGALASEIYKHNRK